MKDIQRLLHNKESYNKLRDDLEKLKLSKKRNMEEFLKNEKN